MRVMKIINFDSKLLKYMLTNNSNHMNALSCAKALALLIYQFYLYRVVIKLQHEPFIVSSSKAKVLTVYASSILSLFNIQSFYKN